MPQPFDYIGAMGGVPNVSQTVQNAVFGEQQRQQNANALDQQAFQLEQAQKQAVIAEQRRAAMSQDFGTLMQRPNAQSVGRFMMTYPEASEGLKKGWDMLSGAQKDAGIKTSADVHGYLSAGDPEGAIKVLQSHMDAVGTTGEDVSGYPAAIEMIRQDPQHALTWSAINLATGMGPEKFADNYKAIGGEQRDNEVQPYKVAQEAADASIKGTEAQYKPSMIQSDLETQASNRERAAAQTANEVARLALDRDHLTLDRDTLESNIGLKLEELDRKGTQLDPGARQVVNSAVSESVSASALADRMNGLADKMEGYKNTSGFGWASTFSEGAKGAFGAQNPVSGLRAEYNQIVNAQAVKNLPPGPASDKDIQLARQGFPPPSANVEYLQSFLRGMGKMQQAVAAGADRKANWVASNGSLAPASRDINVAGVMIPAGTTFNEFNGNAVKRSKQGQMPSGLDGILKKYGGK